ncbi:MAG: Transcription initiation factor TFIID subunit 9 [Bogoriella megaspora]|nr:MAG: Transcription initiation factor TFIID subunit 9 [Bogoriella megaspora]
MSSPAAIPSTDLPTTNGINGTSTPTAPGGGISSPPNPLTTQPTTNPTTNDPSLPPAPPSALQISSDTDPGDRRRPRDARLLHLILSNLGVHAYQERVPLMLLDFAYRYTRGVLSDALHISHEAGQQQIGGGSQRSGGGAGGGGGDGGVTIEALRQAVASRLDYQFGAPGVGKEGVLELAQERNRVALPRPEREFGVRLPPERYCLTGVGWQVRGEWEEEEEEDEEDGDEMGEGGQGRGKEEEMEVEGEREEEERDEFEEVMGVRDSEMKDA